MLSAWWLVIAGLPVFQQPLPEAPGEPAVFAVAAGRVSMRLPCYALVCDDAEWMAPSRYTTLLRPGVPGTLQRLRAATASPLATRRYSSLSAPATPRDWVDTRGSDAKVGATFGVEAIRTPVTDLRVQLGTGYRIVPYTDYGTAAEGLIARGGLQLSQRFGDRTHLNQQVSVETGRHNTYTRQVIGVDFALQPQWTLRSQVEMRHDSRADETDTEGSLKLHYDF